MSLRLCAFLFVLALVPSAWAEEQAFTNRATELKERGADDAHTIATLPENTSVKVIARGGGWTHVDANGRSGWLRVFHLRFPALVEATSSGSGFGSFMSGVTSRIGGGGPAEKKATIATTGVRGLSPEDLKSASPDPAALAKAHSYRADKPAAERFAREGKLAAVSVDYSPGGRR